jgi:hypothetical protein
VNAKWGRFFEEVDRRLDVSLGHGTEEMEHRIREAELESARLWENCGRPATTTAVRGWYRTLCKRCRGRALDAADTTP